MELAAITVGVSGFGPLQYNLSVLTQSTGGLFTHRLKTQAHTDRQKEQLQHTGHEPVCLVPGSVEKYLHVPYCTLQQSLDTPSEGFYSADIGIMYSGSPLDSVACCLMLVAGRPISQRIFLAFSYSSARRVL